MYRPIESIRPSVAILLLIAQLFIKLDTGLCVQEDKEATPFQPFQSYWPTPQPEPLPEGSVTVEAVVKEKIPEEEAQAYLEVETMLNELRELTINMGDLKFLEQSEKKMREILNDPERSTRAETSQRGAIRALSENLMRQLALNYQHVALCRDEELTEANRKIGARSAIIEEQLDIQLIRLNKYLALLSWAYRETCLKRGNNSMQSGSKATSDSEDNWFSKTIKKIF